MTNNLRVQRMTGPALEAYVPALARLRIEVFRDFPYLYDGDPGYEDRHLRTYIDSPGSVIVVVLDGESVVGASTALPLGEADPAFQQPFTRQGFDLTDVFYLGESVLLPAYRGRGLGVRFFEEREAQARELGGFPWAAFCAVDRRTDHPRRPADYQPLDRFWSNRGYTRHPELTTTYHWKDLDENEETEKTMTFWLKRP
jgi:GNAT superfamily N-acetyltransferase